tara:strand:+ start:220 stop:426 length:207 start_codon:yes stop_codon:yes gene_type:complete
MTDVFDEVQGAVDTAFEKLETRILSAGEEISNIIVVVAEAVLEPEDCVLFLEELDKAFGERNELFEQE